MRYYKAIIAGLAASVLVVSISCGGSDSDDAAGPFTPQASEDTEAPSNEGNSSSGSATLTIGDESWTFDVSKCFFPGQFIFDETVVFLMNGTVAIPDNGMLGLKVSISGSTVPGLRLYHTISIFSFIGDDRRAVKEAIRWSASARYSVDDGFILVESKRVTAEALFDNDMTGVKEAIAGTLEATCP